VYPSRPGEKPDRVKLLESFGSSSSSFTRSTTAAFATGPGIRGSSAAGSERAT
jgi:hypothetical protein